MPGMREENQGLIPQITQLSNRIQLIPLKTMSDCSDNTREGANKKGVDLIYI